MCRWLRNIWCIESYVKDDVSFFGFVRDGVSRVIHTERERESQLDSLKRLDLKDVSVFDDLTFETETVPYRRCSIRKSSLHECVYIEGGERKKTRFFISIRRRVGGLVCKPLRTVFRLVA